MKQKEEFINYTNKYLKFGKKIELKINHTFRVEKLCEEIAKSLKLNDEEIELAKLCGLLHDIGRFEQWKKYQTYNDLLSIDHGDLGENILKHHNFINKFTNKNQNTILKAVKYHNKYKVPNTLSEKNRLFVNITRDADKIDILQLFATGELVIDSMNTEMSDKIVNCLKKKELINTTDIKTKADVIAIRLGFIFDLNYQYSLQYIKEKQYIKKIIENQIKMERNEKLINQLKEIEIVMNNYIEEMLTC